MAPRVPSTGDRRMPTRTLRRRARSCDGQRSRSCSPSSSRSRSRRVLEQQQARTPPSTADADHGTTSRRRTRSTPRCASTRSRCSARTTATTASRTRRCSPRCAKVDPRDRGRPRLRAPPARRSSSRSASASSSSTCGPTRRAASTRTRRSRSRSDLPPPDPAVMNKPGFKVIHEAEHRHATRRASRSCCACRQVKTWSDAHPGHVPIMIDVEMKDTTVTPATFDALDAEIRSVLSPRRPHHARRRARHRPEPRARGPHARLADARRGARPHHVHARQRELRADRARRAIRRCAGRILFTSSSPGDDDAAVAQAQRPDRRRGEDQGRARGATCSCAPAPTPTPCRRAPTTRRCATPRSRAAPSS